MKKTLIFITGLIVVVILLIIGLSVYQNYYNTKPQTQNSTPQTQEETFNWKTYQNDEYGFELKYPTDYEVAELKNEDFFIIRYARDLSYENPAYPYMRIEFSSQNYEEAIEGELKRYPQYSESINNIIIGGVPGKKFLYSSEMGNTFQTIILSRNNKAVEIFFSKGSLLEPVISTLKFTS